MLNLFNSGKKKIRRMNLTQTYKMKETTKNKKKMMMMKRISDGSAGTNEES